jgi:hypothetical protein
VVRDHGRRSSTGAVEEMLRDMHALLVDLLHDLPVQYADQTAHALLSLFLGTVVQ